MVAVFTVRDPSPYDCRLHIDVIACRSQPFATSPVHPGERDRVPEKSEKLT